MGPREISFDSVADLLAFVNDPKFGLKLDPEDTLLFRGECERYPTMGPSISRRSKDDQNNLNTLVTAFGYHVVIDLLGPFLEFRDEGPYYKGKWIGRLDWHDAYINGPSYVAIKWQVESVLQHYGWPTPWLDVTFDPTVAVFFASYDFDKQAFTTDGCGYFYIWSLKAIRSSPLYLDVPVVDLDPISAVLSDALAVKSTRPQAQVAGSLGIRSRVEEVAKDVLRDLRTTVVFKRGDALEFVHGKDYYFPQDPLLDALNKLEALYVEDAHRASPTSVGPEWPEYLRFLDRWRKGKAV
jgi:FRG domain